MTAAAVEERVVAVGPAHPEEAQPRLTPASPGLVVARAAALILAALLLMFVAHLLVFSALAHKVGQQRSYADLRNQLAAGTAPVGPVDAKGRVLAPGTPVALLRIPQLGLAEVVRAGTAGSVLEAGPGWLESSTFPGQAGYSAVYGRAEAYGGPFGSLTTLRKGARVLVTTQVGDSTYKVIDVRRPGSPLPPVLQPGQGRLTLVTARESLFMASGVVFVDAVADKVPAGRGATGITPTGSEKPLGTDTSGLWHLIIWFELLALIAVGAVWSWVRWGRAQSWLVGAPAAALVLYLISGGLTALLPNLT